MSWPTGYIPAEVSALRDMLQESETWINNGGNENQIHYPDTPIDNDLALPAALIIREDHTRTPYAAGAAAMPSGTLRIELYADETLAALEFIAQGIAADLAASDVGLAIRSISTDLAGDISGARQAGVDDATAPAYRVAILTISHGLYI